MSESSFKITGAHSTYHALITSFERRFSKGLATQLNYTFSKGIDDSSEEFTNTNRNSRKNTQNRHDFRSSRSEGSFSRPHAFSANVAYDLPFGPGRSFGGNLNGVVGKLVGGWGLSSILSAYSGFPVNVTAELDRARSGTPPGVNTGHRPDLCPGANNNPVLGDPAKWMDPSSFCLQPEGFYGNLGRNTIRGPGLFTFDFSVTKEIPVNERVRVEFVSQFFNLFNHPNFDVPNPAVFGDASGRPLPSFGVITRTSTTSRQGQFALKVVF